MHGRSGRPPGVADDANHSAVALASLGERLFQGLHLRLPADELR